MTTSNARIVLSTRGGQILEHSGFRYQKRSNNRDQTLIYWRCEQRDRCNGTITTNFNTSNGTFFYKYFRKFIRIYLFNIQVSLSDLVEKLILMNPML